jgi:hypothetical protein
MIRGSAKHNTMRFGTSTRFSRTKKYLAARVCDEGQGRLSNRIDRGPSRRLLPKLFEKPFLLQLVDEAIVEIGRERQLFAGRLIDRLLANQLLHQR